MKLKDLVGKTIKEATWISNKKTILLFEDKSTLTIYGDSQLALRLIEPTLDSDVIPIGANTLGESSV
jgi:hypothetical protein